MTTTSSFVPSHYKDAPKWVLEKAAKLHIESEGGRFLKINWNHRNVHFLDAKGHKKTFSI